MAPEDSPLVQLSAAGIESLAVLRPALLATGQARNNASLDAIQRFHGISLPEADDGSALRERRGSGIRGAQPLAARIDQAAGAVEHVAAAICPRASPRAYCPSSSRLTALRGPLPWRRSPA